MKVEQTDSRTSRWLARLCACLVFISVALGQSGLTKTLREADGGGHVNGYYNKTDSQYSNGGLQVQLAGLTAEVSHKVEFSKNNGSTWSGANQLWFKGGLVTNAIISTDVAENAVNFDIYHSQLTTAPYSMSNGETIQIRVINDVFATKDTFVCTITGGGNDLTYDITPPTISSVSSGTGNGTYAISANINITVTFSEPTTLSNGSLRVTLNTGQNVDIAAATYSNTASGTYQVQEGDLVGDLNNTGVSITGISLADDAGNEVENYTPGSNLGATSDIVIDGVRPTITSVTSTTTNGTYGIGDDVNITVTFSEATTVAGGNLRVTLDVVQNVDITGATYNTTASGTYTIQQGDASVDLTTTNIAITAGTIEDDAGNALTTFTPVSNLATTSNLIIDGIRPTITSVNSSDPSTTYGIGDNIDVTVYFSETVTLASGNLLVELETGAVDQQAIITPFAGASSGTGTYTVQINDVSADLTENSVSLSGGTLRDAAGNDLTVFTVPPAENLNDNKAIVVDGVRPTISSITSLSGDGDYKIGDDILIQVTFDEAVTLAGGNLLITLETGTADQQVTISSVVSSTTATGTYTVQNGDESADLTANVVGLSAGTLEDVGGNNVTDFTIPGGQNIADLKAIVVDGVRPTIDYITSTTVDETYNIGDPVNVRLFFTEAVTTAGGGSIVVTLETGGIDQQVTISNVTSSLFADGTYTVQDGDESTDLNVNSVAMSAGSLEDDFGNAVTDFSIPGGSNLADAKALVIDGVRPTVTNVSATTSNGAYKAGDDIDITVEFSQVVNVLGLPTLNLDVGGGYLVSNPAGTGTNTLTFTYTIQATHNSGDLDYVDTASLLPGTSIKDAAGNDATLTLYAPGAGVPGAGSLGVNKALIIDTTSPTVTDVTSSAGNGAYKAWDIIPVTVTFSEVVTVSGSPTLKLETGITDRNATYTGVSGNTLSFEYIVQPGDETNDLDYWDANSLTAGTYIRDAASNDATLTLAIPGDPNSLGDNKALVIDTTPPTVSSVSSTAGDGYYVKTDLIPITITFSEAVYVAITTPTLTLETGTADAIVNYVNGSDGDAELLFNYTVGLGHESDNLDYTATDALQLNLATIQDAAGNDAVLTLVAPGASGSLGFSKDRNVDAIIPTVMSVTSNKADGIYKAGVVIPVSVVFSEAVAVAGGVPTLTLNVGGGYAVDYTSVSGDTLVFEYTVQAGQNQVSLDYLSTAALILNGGTIQDAAGNNADIALALPTDPASLSGAKNLDIDTTPPEFSSVVPATSSYCNVTTVSYTLSEELASGTITWSRTGGAADPASHIQTLTGTELAAGVHTDITLTNDPALVSGTVYSITFAGQDAAGNVATSIVHTDVTFDNTPPMVSSVSSTAGDGYYVAGDTISITVTFTETVYKAGAGTLTLALETGSTDAVLDYASGSGTGTLTFIYIVALGHESDNLDYIDANALQLNLITIRDTTGNDADLALPTPGTSGSLGYGNDRNIDAIIPTVTAVTSTKVDGAYKAAQVIPIAVVFSEAVAVTGAPKLTLNVGSGYVVDFSSISSDTVVFNYTIQAGQNKVNLGYQSTTALSLSGGTIQDAADNDADTTLATPGGASSLSGAKDLDVDTTPPAFSSVAPADSSYQNSTKVSYTLSEDIASGSITWSRTGGTADPAEPHSQALTGSELSTGAHADITLTNDPSLVSGTVYSLTFAGQDAAGNAATNIVRTDVTFDDTPPQAALTYSDTLASQGDTVTITVTLSEAALDTPGITIEYTSITQPSNAALTATADSLVWTYDAIIPSGNDGTATVTIGMDDLAANALTTANTTGRTDLMVDNTPPGYVLAYSDSLVKEGDIVTITATFEESVKSAPATKPTIAIDLADSDSDTSGAAMSMGPADTVWIYALDIPSKNDGFATVIVSATDAAGIPAVPVSGSTNTLKVDNTPPEITVAEPDSGDFRQTTAVDYTLPQAIDSGTVTWTRESGPADGTPHVQILTASETAAGTHDAVLTDAPTLVQGTTYTLDFIIIDKAGNPDTTTIESVMFDTLAPDIANAVLLDSLAATDIDSTQSTTSLSGRYYGFVDDDAGIALYEYAIGSTKGDTDLVGWTDNATDTTFTATGLSLDLKAWYWLMARATDRAGNVSDTVFSEDGVRIIARPAPTVAVVQNSALPAYLQIFITDTLGMANSITVKADSVTITHSIIDTFTYLANHKLLSAGILDVEVTGHSAAGDSTVSASISIALAKRGQPWVAASVDQRFKTAGSPGSVSGDRYLLVVDSTLMGLSVVHGGAYRLGDGQFTFDQPVRVSLHRGMSRTGQEEAQAIYVLRSNDRWEELPSVDQGELVTTWANSTGTFRLGRRTIIVPRTTGLHQNYPNPFNPTTRIVFDLGFQDGPEQQTSIIIYNLLGQEVRTLFDGVTPAGRYELVWRGIDKRGASVASGVYFVRLLTGSGRVATKKMLLVR